MEGLPKIIDSKQLPVEITPHPYMMDHRFEGKAMLPAVEAMQLLAVSTRSYLPETDIHCIVNARFDKFLYLEADHNSVEAFNEIDVHANGAVVSRLITKTRSKKAFITRTKEHVALCFQQGPQDLKPLPLDIACSLDGICIEISPEKLYRELVLFGPAYQNIKGTLRVSKKGALAEIRAPISETHDKLLGSPFPLDAAFHAACAWGQRYSGIVGFPFGFDRRLIVNKTRPGESYWARIVPVNTRPDQLIFDIWIYDLKGLFCEAALGVRMRDVSGGHMEPPAWIKDDPGDDELKCIRDHCSALCVMELEAPGRPSEMALSGPERVRFNKMGHQRKKSYVAARLCCKSLFRKLSGNDLDTPAHVITTISPDQIHPCCPVTIGTSHFSCSVSHDSRFAIAVASENNVGIDVEEISEKVLKSQGIFMKQTEIDLAQRSSLGEIMASLRIWSIKEAVSKAWNINLASSWDRVRVTDIGLNRSGFLLTEQDCFAFHDTVDSHLFTIIGRSS